MTLNHIQLNTTDVNKQAAFYMKHFGFTRRVESGTGLFLWNPSGFMMAINPLENPPEFPRWFHIGFRLESVDEVRTLHSTLERDQANPGPLSEYDDFVFFRVRDPANYEIEVFWEPPPQTP